MSSASEFFADFHHIVGVTDYLIEHMRPHDSGNTKWGISIANVLTDRARPRNL